MPLSHHDLLAAAALAPAQGHAHFRNSALSRRGFLTAGAGAVGAAALLPLLGSPVAFAGGGAEPKPVPGGSVPPPAGGHVWLPQRGLEPSTIFDFDGTVALADIWGSGEGHQSGHAFPVHFNADMRFMTGRYVSLDGVTRQGTFGFF
jgi:hypothetical protein